MMAISVTPRFKLSMIGLRYSSIGPGLDVNSNTAFLNMSAGESFDAVPAVVTPLKCEGRILTSR